LGERRGRDGVARGARDGRGRSGAGGPAAPPRNGAARHPRGGPDVARGPRPRAVRYECPRRPADGDVLGRARRGGVRARGRGRGQRRPARCRVLGHDGAARADGTSSTRRASLRASRRAPAPIRTPWSSRLQRRSGAPCTAVSPIA
jgi:hypothetical protein